MPTRGLLSEELKQIRNELSCMTARVEEDLGKSLMFLRTGNEELAQAVKDSGKIVDAMQLKIEDRALELIATQQPVAGDLRELITVFKIAASIERIGDYGIHLVKTVKKLSEKPAFNSMQRIERMVETGQLMLRAAFSAYILRDAKAARKAAQLDREIDNEHKLLTEEVLALMKKEPRLVKAAARLLRLSGFMERLGDHVTSMCEGIVYMTEGRREELNI